MDAGRLEHDLFSLSSDNLSKQTAQVVDCEDLENYTPLSDNYCCWMTVPDYPARTVFFTLPYDYYEVECPSSEVAWEITVDQPDTVYVDCYEWQEQLGFHDWNRGWTRSTMESVSWRRNQLVDEDGEVHGPWDFGTGVVYEKTMPAGTSQLFGIGKDASAMGDFDECGSYFVFIAPRWTADDVKASAPKGGFFSSGVKLNTPSEKKR